MLKRERKRSAHGKQSHWQIQSEERIADASVDFTREFALIGMYWIPGRSATGITFFSTIFCESSTVSRIARDMRDRAQTEVGSNGKYV